MLISDARLHLQKSKRQNKAPEKQVIATNNVNIDDELCLDIERRMLMEKVKQRRELARLQKELNEVSEGRVSSEYQIENCESSWRTSTESDFTKTEESSGSFSSKRRKRRIEHDESSEDKDYYKERKSAPSNLTEDDVLLFKDFIRTRSGEIEVSSESPLSKRIERTKIKRDLKVPSINQFDGSADPADFIHLFDCHMAFYGHSDEVKCQYFSTCLKGPALMWYNNLLARSIKSRSTLKINPNLDSPLIKKERK